ncbi:FG-GAP-like repeat-containing protein [Microbispora sp. NPDC049125]|uniref:FG-GAP-like repeat-containing protein n=1 Tax=Microbispora sp. NPDC049125 TaxID=3154929 RepID=UPI003466A3E9
MGVPRGPGGTLADDVNGDGHSDALIVSERAEGVRFLTVLYGSRGGLAPERRTVVQTGGQKLWLLGGSWRARRPDTADLDGDGFADIPVLLWSRNSTWPVLRVIWGGPEGPVADGLSPTVPVPAAERLTSDWPATGDFDGDGHPDLVFAVPDSGTPEKGAYTVLYGPFGRDGTPRRTVTALSPEIGKYRRYLGWVVADRIRPGRRTGLIIHAGDDGEQTGAVVLPQVPPSTVHLLGPGNAIASGDFDGDGRVDVAVGDDGSRNDEPGYETSGATNALTVYYGRAPQAPVTIPIPHIHDKLTAADVDGDGRDDLVLQVGDQVEVRTRGLSTTRTLGPFRCPTRDRLERRPGAVRAGDYDGDGRAEVLISCWSYIFGRDPKLWWVWDANGPGIRFDTTGFTP